MSGHGLSSHRLRSVAHTPRRLLAALAVVLLAGQAASPRLWAADPADPRPPHNPFGEPPGKEAPVDPFGEDGSPAAAKRIAEMLREAERKRYLAKKRHEAEQKRHLVRTLRATGIALAGQLAADPDDALCLEGTLALLHLSAKEPRADVDPLELLAEVSRRRWQRAPGEPASAMLARMHAAFDTAPQEDAVAFRRLPARYGKVTDAAWPLDWQAKRDFWLGLIETVVHSRQAADPAPVWRAKIAADPADADWYRLGYLAAVRADLLEKPGQDKGFDYALVQPWIEVGGPLSDLHLRRMADVYRTATLASLPEEHPARAASLRRLLRELSERRFMGGERNRDLLPALAEIYKSNGRVGRLLARRLVDHQSPRAFESFAVRAGIPQQEQHSWFLGKPVSVTFRDEPLGEALRSLQAEVRVPLWIDESARKDSARVTLEASGPWIEVLESTLVGSKCRLELLRPDLLWIGTPEALPDAAALLRESLAKVPDSRGPLGKTLHSLSTLEFIETPLQDTLDYMKDLHGIEIAMTKQQKGFGSAPVTLRHEGIPACVALSLITRKAGGDWSILDNVVVVAPTDWIEQFHRQRVARLRRAVRLNRTEVVGNALAESTTLEFIETPLSDVIDYLCQLHDVNVTLAQGLDRDMPVTFNMKGVTLDTALDLMLFRLGLSWDSDGEVIYVGDNKAVGAFTAMAAGRPARLGRYPKELAEKLKRRIERVEFDQTPLPELVAWLDKAAAVGVRLGPLPEGATSEKVDLHLKKVPLDVLLDLVCLDLGLKWRATDRQTVVIESR